MQAEQLSQALLRDQQAVDASKENLFVEMVCKKLVPQMEPWDDRDVPYYGETYDCGSQNDIMAIAKRLHSLENYVVKLDEKLEFLVQHAQASVPASVPVQRFSFSAPMSPLSSSSSLTSTHSSPSPSNRFNFQCPLCLVPQFTPKSHCEHLRNTIDPGVHVCRFDEEHKRHDRIIKLWGSGTAFVRWYTSFLRSGMGRNFSERDTNDYASLQTRLQGILNGSIVLQRE